MGDVDLDEIFRIADSLLYSNARNQCHRIDAKCQYCSSWELVLDHVDGSLVCWDCARVQSSALVCGDYAVDCNYSQLKQSNYKRIHHFHERLSQLLLQESRIPDEAFDRIRAEIKQRQITELSKTNIRAVLRALGMQIYIEKWLQIIHRLTGCRPPPPPSAVLVQLDMMFLALQIPFLNHRPHNRRNFLNYNMVFQRLFQRLGVPEYAQFFPLIKSKHKLEALDEVWRQMCASLNWEFMPLPSVRPFAISVDPTSL